MYSADKYWIYYIASEKCTESCPFKQVESFSGHHTWSKTQTLCLVFFFFFDSLHFFFCLTFTWIREMLDGEKGNGWVTIMTFPNYTFKGSRFWSIAPCKGIGEIFAYGNRNPGKIGMWNLKSWALESWIQLKESGILLTIGIQNLSSTDKYWNQMSGIRNPRRGIHNPGLVDYPRRGEK